MGFEIALYIQTLAAIAGVAAIPPSYVLEVEHTCSSTPEGESRVDILTDLSVVVRVECLTRSIIVPTTDKVNYFFTAKYQGDTATQCVFKRRKNSGAYVLLVTVAWSEPRETFKAMQEQYLVTCTLAPHAINQTREHHTEDGLLAPLELQERQGNRSTSNFTIDITDIAGNPLLSHIDIGRKIQLRSKMVGRDGDVGFRAVSCNAVAGNYTYAVLRGGCGDGIVFPRNSGFTTEGSKIISPFFEAFKLKEEDFLSFECNFTTCKQVCNGDSCTHEDRRKRDTAGNIDTTDPSTRVTLRSNSVQLVESGGDESRPRQEAQRQESVEEVLRLAGDVDSPGQEEALRRAGIELVPARCRQTASGLECESVEYFETETNSDYYSLLAISLLLVQGAVSVCMVVAMVVAGSGTRAPDIFSCTT